MTAREIADRLCLSEKGVTPLRLEKARKLAERSKVAWSEVLVAITDEERAQVTHAEPS